MGRGEVAGFDSSVVLSNRDFGVGAGLPLDGGGTVVGDKVTITLAIAAVVRSKQAANRPKDQRVLPTLREILARE